MNYQKFLNEAQRVVLQQNYNPPQIRAITHGVHTMSKIKVLGLLNRAVSCMDGNEVYLEIGVHQGGSLLSALAGNTKKAIAVDDFSQFGEVNPKLSLAQNIIRFGVGPRVEAYDMEFHKYFKKLHDPFINVGVYYYDGDHSEDATIDGLEMGMRILHPGSLMFLDDYRWPSVHKGMTRFLGYHQGEVYPILVMSTAEDNNPEWHNGVCVLLVGGGL